MTPAVCAYTAKKNLAKSSFFWEGHHYLWMQDMIDVCFILSGVGHQTSLGFIPRARIKVNHVRHLTTNSNNFSKLILTTSQN